MANILTAHTPTCKYLWRVVDGFFIRFFVCIRSFANFLIPADWPWVLLSIPWTTVKRYRLCRAFFTHMPFGWAMCFKTRSTGGAAVLFLLAAFLFSSVLRISLWLVTTAHLGDDGLVDISGSLDLIDSEYQHSVLWFTYTSLSACEASCTNIDNFLAELARRMVALGDLEFGLGLALLSTLFSSFVPYCKSIVMQAHRATRSHPHPLLLLHPYLLPSTLFTPTAHDRGQGQ